MTKSKQNTINRVISDLVDISKAYTDISIKYEYCNISGLHIIDIRSSNNDLIGDVLSLENSFENKFKGEGFLFLTKDSLSSVINVVFELNKNINGRV